MPGGNPTCPHIESSLSLLLLLSKKSFILPSKARMKYITITVAVMALAFLSFTSSSFAKTSMKASKKAKMVTTQSGLQYIDEVVGKGAEPKTGQTVTVNYTGWLKDG